MYSPRNIQPFKTSVQLVAIITAVIFSAALGSAVSDAKGATWPDVPCADTWSAPQSPAADTCREQGWTINGHLAVGPHGVLRHSGLAHCPYEDGSRVTLRCIWIGTADGNERGLSYWFGQHHPMRPHYIWPASPIAHNPDPRWSWVDRELADALADGGSPHADTRNWQRCVVHVASTTRVFCPDKRRPVEVS